MAAEAEGKRVEEEEEAEGAKIQSLWMLSLDWPKSIWAMIKTILRWI